MNEIWEAECVSIHCMSRDLLWSGRILHIFEINWSLTFSIIARVSKKTAAPAAPKKVAKKAGSKKVKKTAAKKGGKKAAKKGAKKAAKKAAAPKKWELDH